MKMTINKESKTFKDYKEFLNRKFNDDGLVESESNVFIKNINDGFILASIEASPMQMIYFFDSVGLIGTLHYEEQSSFFGICVDGYSIPDGEDWLGDKDRRNAEIKLINYLTSVYEKTL